MRRFVGLYYTGNDGYLNEPMSGEGTLVYVNSFNYYAHVKFKKISLFTDYVAF